MKNIILIAAAFFITTSCKQDNTELATSNRERDSLIGLANEREESINEFIAAFNEVERNLDSVSAKQQIIYTSSSKTGNELKDQKSKINEEITSINNLMKENTEKIAELTRKLKNSASRNRHLAETITILNNQLAEKNTELSSLNERLYALNVEVSKLEISVDTLTAQNYANSKLIAEGTKALHTAYYVIGKTKELEEAKLIDRKGGLLGIGKTSKLSENFDASKFTRIDYTQTGSIPINSDGVKIITTHPADSYTLDKDAENKRVVKNLVITDPEKFWSASKYLVIVKG